MHVAVVILAWNNRAYLERFLPVLQKYTPASQAELIVVDNASEDDTADWLKQQYPGLRRICLARNLGYAGAYNTALAGLPHDYFICLNSDVEVTNGWLDPLIRLMEENPEIGACMPKLLSLNAKNEFEYAGAAGGFLDHWGYPFCRGRIFNIVETDRGQYDEPQQIFWASGACLMLRAKAFRQSGGFDPRFFAHMEEIDLCWRMKNRGWTIWCQPSSFVYHLGGGSLSSENPRKSYLNFRNNLLMLFKNLPVRDLCLVLPIRLILDGVAVLRFMVKGQMTHCLAVLQAHLAFYRNLKGLRSSAGHRTSLKKLQGIYRGSIAFEFFLNDIQQFSALDGEKINRL